ncbi:hypothetical protein ABZP36_000353 [Zizania latifolia]
MDQQWCSNSGEKKVPFIEDFDLELTLATGAGIRRRLAHRPCRQRREGGGGGATGRWQWVGVPRCALSAATTGGALSPSATRRSRTTLVAVAVRERRRVYALVAVDTGKKWQIEEVAWRKEGEGEMVMALVLIGAVLAIFMFWRFQMRQLAGNMNKKIVTLQCSKS